MAEVDTVADAIHALIQRLPSSPTKDQIRSAIYASKPEGMRDLLLPAAMDRMGRWNKANPDQKMECDFIVSGDRLFLVVNDEPKHRKVVPVEWLGLAGRADQKDYLDSVFKSALPTKNAE